MKVMTVVGARPQFIKAAVVSCELRKKHKEILVHTGQHYDYNMSEQFFEELEIPKPDYNLGISGGTHAEMTGHMLMGIEKVLVKEKPDMLLVYGDTNSTLAAALAAAKLHIPICHVEAGCRTFSMSNPEEINRVCTDRVSSLLLTSTKTGNENLLHEGLDGKAVFVGDPMYDAFVKYSEQAQHISHSLQSLRGEQIQIPEKYYYLTCHREENTQEESQLSEVFKAMNGLDAKTIYPVHPRNKKRAIKLLKENDFQNILLVEPVGYLTSLYLVKNAVKIVTDSGGLQREAFFAGVQCVTVLNFVCWPEIMVNNRNQLASADSRQICEKLQSEQNVDFSYQPFGDGNAAVKIVNEMENYYKVKGLGE